MLLIKPPFDVEEFIPHVENVRKFRLENKTDAPQTIYIYENEKLIKDAPFNSFSSAHKALGLKSTSNTCNRYLDTNRLYKSKFKITSKPINTTATPLVLGVKPPRRIKSSKLDVISEWTSNRDRYDL